MHGVLISVQLPDLHKFGIDEDSPRCWNAPVILRPQLPKELMAATNASATSKGVVMTSRWLPCNYAPHAMLYHHGIGIFSTQEATQRIVEAQHLRWKEPTRTNTVAGTHSAAPTSMGELLIMVIAELFNQPKPGMNQLVNSFWVHPI